MAENKYYERKIKYLDLMENGERVGGAGFIKTEVRGMEISLAVTVKGLHPTDTYEREVLLLAGDGEFAAGRIALKEGQGQFQYHTVMDYSQLHGIRIVLGGIREICCRWQEEKRSAVMRNGAVENSAEPDRMTYGGNAGEAEVMEVGQRKSEKPREIQIIPWDEIKAVEKSLERTEKAMSKSAEEEKPGRVSAETETTEKETVTEEMVTGKTDTAMEKEAATARKTITGRMAEKETAAKRTARAAVTGEAPERPKRVTENSVRTGDRNSGTENASAGRNAERRAERPAQRAAASSFSGREKKPVRLMEDKWQQIWAIYPHIHPFQDEREYLSIGPADFVLLPDDAYRAANNSFLLHGYYNYDHLILTKIERRGEVSYYIGVPGNYYEREKQVAIMFGFESFECGTEPAQAGDFGYYMMRTQL